MTHLQAKFIREKKACPTDWVIAPIVGTNKVTLIYIGAIRRAKS